MPGLHICNVELRGSDSRGEYVEIANDGTSSLALTGLELTTRPRSNTSTCIASGRSRTARP